MAKRLIVSKKAYLDIDRIVEFNNLRNQSERYSQKFLKSLFKIFDQLETHPLMGMKTSKGEDRVLIWNDYYIYYQIVDPVIEVKAIYHQKENIDR